MNNKEYRMIQDDDGHWYIIPAGEEKTFYKWLDFRLGLRRKPANFEPIAVDGPHAVKFEKWNQV